MPRPASRGRLNQPTATHWVMRTVGARTSILLSWSLKCSLLYGHSISLCWLSSGQWGEGCGSPLPIQRAHHWIQFSEMSVFSQGFMPFHVIISHLSYYYYLKNFPSFLVLGFFFLSFLFLCGLAYVLSHSPVTFFKQSWAKARQLCFAEMSLGAQLYLTWFGLRVTICFCCFQCHIFFSLSDNRCLLSYQQKPDFPFTFKK